MPRPFRGHRRPHWRARPLRSPAFRPARSIASIPAAIAAALVVLTAASGGAPASAATDLRFAVLPPAARPRHNLWITTYTFGGAIGALLIRPSGVMSAFNVTGNAAQTYTSLAGISYPLGS